MEVHRDDRHQPHCYGYLVAMVTKRYLNNTFVLSPIEFVFDMDFPKDDKHQPHTLLQCNKQHPGSLSA